MTKTTREIEAKKNNNVLKGAVIISIIISVLVGFIVFTILRVQINDLPKRVCWNETIEINKTEFCQYYLWGNQTDICYNTYFYEQVKYLKPELIKSTKEVCEIK